MNLMLYRGETTWNSIPEAVLSHYDSQFTNGGSYDDLQVCLYGGISQAFGLNRWHNLRSGLSLQTSRSAIITVLTVVIPRPAWYVITRCRRRDVNPNSEYCFT